REKFGVYPRGMHNTPQEITPVVSNFIRHKQIQWAKMCQKRDAAAKSAMQAEVKREPENHADNVRRLLAAKPVQQGSLL
ncbi:TPA: hypothetical protein I7721_21750, partial [Vibrio vulnificus]|nr:hypothetical protein [Vibrio vulnificus]